MNNSKTPIGVTYAHIIYAKKGFSQVIYKRAFKPKTLEVSIVLDPSITSTEYDCKNVSFRIKIYGHDSKSKGKRVINEIHLPFYETRNIVLFAQNERDGVLVDKYIQFFHETYCPEGVTEAEKVAFYRTTRKEIIQRFEVGNEPIRLSTYFSSVPTEKEIEMEHTLCCMQLHYLPTYKDEKSNKPWIFSVDRWVGANYGNLDNEPVLMGHVDDRSAIRMTRAEFLEFAGIIENAMRRWLADAFFPGERIPSEIEHYQKKKLAKNGNLWYITKN